MKKFIIITVGILLTLFLLGYFVAFKVNYSEGTRAGTIMKFSKKGIIIKTYEGQINLGGFAGSGGEDITSTLWNFSVDRGDDAVKEKIEEAMDYGYRVKLHYEEKLFRISWRGDSKYFVTDVQKVAVPPSE